MNNFNLYFHAGSGNHGCEAIVRATSKLLGTVANLYTSNSKEDRCYNLDSVVNIIEDIPEKLIKGSLKYYRAVLSHKIHGDDFEFIKLMHKSFFDSISPNGIYFSIGGDNYCYKGRDILGYYNKCIHKKGGKTVLWGCSCGSENIDDSIARDLSLYNLIVAREKITFETLKQINPNTVLLPDPAFQLDIEELPLPRKFDNHKFIGVNLSPLIMEYGNGEIIFNNYKHLLEYILTNTDYHVLLIPHVVKDGNDDRTILRRLMSEFEDTDKLFLVNDCNCMQLKGYISRCDLFVGARTHATIAAYSTCVPTLVVGYSVKSIGIARELFGTDQDYVIPVQNLNDDSKLVNNFKWLVDNSQNIREHLSSFMPEYKNRLNDAKKLIEEL